MFDRTFRVTGRVDSEALPEGVGSLRIELWDRDPIKDDWLAQTTTDEDGTFAASFAETRFSELGLDRQPELYIRVFDAETLRFSTRPSPVSAPTEAVHEDQVEIDLGVIHPPEGWSRPTPEQRGEDTRPARNSLWLDSEELVSTTNGPPVEELDDAGPYLVRLVLETLSLPADDEAWVSDCQFVFHSVVRTAGSDRPVRRRHPNSGAFVGTGDDVAVGTALYSAYLGEEAGVSVQLLPGEEPSDSSPGGTVELSGDPASWPLATTLEGPWEGTLRIEVESLRGPLFRNSDGTPTGKLKRAAWLHERVATPTGELPDDLWADARAAKARMQSPSAFDDDPGSPGDDGLRIEGVGSGDASFTDPPVDERYPMGTETYVNVELDDARPVSLSIAVSPEATSHLTPGSLRLFRYDEAREGMVLVDRSGLGSDGTYVYAQIHRSGTYGVLGLPRDVASRVTERILCELQEIGPLVEITERPDLERRLVDEVCQLVLCRFDEGVLTNPERLAEIGLEDLIDDPALVSGGRLVEQPLLERIERGDPQTVQFEGSFREGRPTDGGFPGVRSGGDPCADCLERSGGTIIEEREVPSPGCQLGKRGRSWRNRGPFNIAGRIKSLAFHPTNDSIVYAGAAQGGVWRSFTEGRIWSPTMSEEESLSIGSVAVSPAEPDWVYAGTGEYPGWAATATYPGVGVYRSTNRGSTWSKLPGARNQYCSKVIVDPRDATRVYLAGSRGIERWEETSMTWTQILAEDTSDIAFDPNDPDRLVAAVERFDGTDAAIVRTNEATATAPAWQRIDSGIDVPEDLNFGKLALATDTMYCSINTTKTKTVDEGTEDEETKEVHNGAKVYRWNGSEWVDKGRQVNSTQSYWCNAISVNPDDSDHVIVAGVGWGNRRLRFSTDGGDTWEERHAGYADNHAIVFRPSDTATTLVANDGGVWRHEGGVGSYENSSSKLVTAQFYNVDVSKTGNEVIGGATQDRGILKNELYGDYVPMGGNEGGIFEIDPSNEDIIYWDPWNRDPRRTTTGDSSGRVSAEKGLDGTDNRVRSLTALAIDPTDSDHLIGAQYPTQGRFPMYESTDGADSSDSGTGWTKVLSDAGGKVYEIQFAPSDVSRVYAVANGGNVWRSDDDGSSFTQVANSTLPNRRLTGVAVDDADPDTVFVTLGDTGIGTGHVWMNTTAGEGTWQDISGMGANRLPDQPFGAIDQHPGNGDILYAASMYGVYRSTDRGVSWTPFDQGLPNAVVTDMDRRERTLYVSTIGRGMYSRDLSP